MAIIGFQETGRNRGAARNDQRDREYLRTFDLFSDRRDELQIVVIEYPFLPRVWSPYVTSFGEADTGSWCREVRVNQDTVDPTLWRAEARYSSRLERPDLAQIQNPLLRPPDVTDGGKEVMVPMEFDADGFAIINTAGDRFDPPPEEEDVRLVTTIVKNQASFDRLNVLLYRGAVNSQPFLGFPTGQVRCADIQSVLTWENGYYFYRVTYTFETRFPRYAGEEPGEVWMTRILNRGFNELVPVSVGSAGSFAGSGAGTSSQGPSYGTSASEIYYGGPDWSSLDQALDADASGATVILGPNEETLTKLFVSGYGFSLATSPIGIQVEVGLTVSPDERLERLYVFPRRGSQGFYAEQRTEFNAQTGTLTFGGPADGWISGWHPAWVNDPTFGIAVSVKAKDGPPGTAVLVSIDFVRVTIWTGPATGSGFGTISSYKKRRITIDGNYAASPQLLHESGRKLRPGEQPYYVVVDKRRRADFNQLYIF